MRKSHRGFTLVEILIALVINMLLFAGLLVIFLANVRHSRITVNTDQLNQQLLAIMDMMSNDIRRAGYWANAQNDLGTHQNNNPFMTSTTDITVPSSSCILFTYDTNADGTLSSITSSSDDEHSGFRLNGQTIQARPPGATYDCSAASSAWESMTDTNSIVITNLTFTLNTKTVTVGPNSRGITMRSVDVSLTGELASDSTVSKTITQHIRIRNDKFIP